MPVPVMVFFVPHFDLHIVSSESYLNRCGASTRLVNRDVSDNKTACIAANLTRIITRGVWQWCPAYVAWFPDVLADRLRSTGMRTEDH